MKLKDKIALVTGSARGIGAAIAQGMAAEGAHVVVNDKHLENGADETAEAIEKTGRKAVVVRADVGVAVDVERMFDRIKREFGKLDVLVNNAGVTLKRPLDECSEADWDQVLSANLKGPFLCARAALPLMHPGGAILNISSVHAHITTFNFSAYAASKGGMEALTRSLAIELGERGIRVNALRLGWIQVERTRVGPDDPRYRPTCDRIPLRRLGEVEDVVPTAVHLCSDDARYITGQVIAIDGGHGTILNTAYPKGHVDGGAVD